MSDCVLSTYCKTNDGYARLSVNNKMQYHHRLAYVQHHNLTMDDIKGKVVMHTCDNPPCINPEHLRLGTQADNMKDMGDKCRHSNKYKTNNKNGVQGVCCINNKYGAQIFMNHRSHWLGTFDTSEEAHAAYLIALENKRLNSGSES